MNYFISDLHFGHENCLAFDNRPWTDVKKMDVDMIQNWNNAVGMDDDVYVLGDISWYGSTETLRIFEQLNGRIRLIRGNHDHKILRNRPLQNRFCEITDYKELDIGDGKLLVLSHYPIPCFRNHYYGAIHLYGHVHTGFEYNMMRKVAYDMKKLYDKPCRMYNVGAMIPYMNYTPRTLEEILSFTEENLK